MYNAVVQRVQRMEISFSEGDFIKWTKENPHVNHTHEQFVRSMAEAASDWPESWMTMENDIICILYGSDC